LCRALIAFAILYIANFTALAAVGAFALAQNMLAALGISTCQLVVWLWWVWLGFLHRRWRARWRTGGMTPE
jgi:hypothetical protein